VTAAVSELEEEYAGQVTFTIIEPEVTKTNGDVQAYELDTHGMVAFDPAGEVITTLPGHDFGKEEIEEMIGTVLGEG
jgi:hypothetical protein